MNKLEILCQIHKQQGGTIFDFERIYKIEFHRMSMDAFATWVRYAILGQPLNETEFKLVYGEF